MPKIRLGRGSVPLETTLGSVFYFLARFSGKLQVSTRCRVIRFSYVQKGNVGEDNHSIVIFCKVVPAF